MSMMEDKLIRNEQEAIECLKKNKPTSGYYMLQESVDMAIKALEGIQQYRAICTVEEFKALKEKQIPKKPEICADVYNAQGELIGKDYRCSDCGMGVAEEYICCPYCAQHLDWSEVE